MEHRQRRFFPESFKREAVDRVATSGLSAGRVAAELGLHETVLRRWMIQFGTQATGPARRPNTQAPAPSPSDLASENARLRRENDRLRMERDILKKAALIFGSAAR
jgi:transposase